MLCGSAGRDDACDGERMTREELLINNAARWFIKAFTEEKGETK